MSTSYKDEISIITFTHLWKDAPSTELIENMLDSIYKYIDISNCRHIINYDKKGVSEREEEYLSNLQKLKDIYNPNIEITTYTTSHKNRSEIYADLVENCDTKYVILWEHDFILERDIDIQSIIECMDNYSNINYIRFSKRELVAQGNIDKWMVNDTECPIPLVKFCGYTGNPHIERREWFLSYCKPLIHKIFVNKRNSIERAMNRDIMSRREKHGFEKTHEFLGTYAYGRLGDKRFVNPSTMFKSKEAWGNKKPKKEWREFNKKNI